MDTNEKLFHKNAALWAHTNPKPAVMLPYVDCSHLIFSKTKQGELNLKKVENGKASYYHSTYDAAKESQRWFSKLPLTDIEVIYVFGVGLGHIFHAAKKWLKQGPNHHLVFLEDDLSVIHRLLETKNGTQILLHPQVQLHHFENLEDKTSPINELYWQFLTTKVTMTSLPYYTKTREDVKEQLHHKLSYDSTVRHGILQEYLEYGVAFFRNFYPNIKLLAGASLGDGIAGKFQGVPAIICGAGPSLNKHLHLLKQLEDKALIFGGGSALNSLNSVGMQPHLGAGIDPNPAQLDRLSSSNSFELPFLYRNRMEFRAFRTVHGPRLYITGSGGYDITDWFDEQLGIKGIFIDEGHNVVNFCISIAGLWGCNPIILVGMDLAYTEMQSYALGVISETSVSKEEILSSAEMDSRALLRPDINGKPVYTLWKWIAEAQWIGEYSQEHPESTVINATEGGIGFPHIPNASLQSVVETYLTRSYELKDRLHGEIQSRALSHITEERIQALLDELRESLTRSQEYLETLIEEAEKLIKQIDQEQQMPRTFQSGLAALAETELAEEVAYRYILNSFNVVYSKVLNRELREIIWSQKGAVPDWKVVLQRLMLNNKKLSFLRDVTRANIALIDFSMELFKQKGTN